MVSVVVCTKDRPDSLLVVLRGLTALHYKPYEIVVVDNAPSSDATEQAVLREFGQDSRVRYVREPRRRAVLGPQPRHRGGDRGHRGLHR